MNLSKKYFSKPKAVARESDQEILEFFHSLKSDKPYLELPEELYEKMEPAHGIIARDLMEEPRFVKLPKSEIRFFEWLKEKDGKVWNDLWGGDSNVYLVSLAFLPMLFENDGRGYPICDLETIENYYFMETHMVGDEGKTMMETSQKLFLDQKGLTIQQLLALEISIGPIDIWHFAYKHGMDIEKSKEAAREMADDGLLVHLTEAKHLAPFIQI